MQLHKNRLYLVIGIFILISGLVAFTLLQNLQVKAVAPILVSNTNNEGYGSLRQAILDANQSIGNDTIAFYIGSGHQTIIPSSPLPPIIYPVTINATTQTGYTGAPLIEIRGNGAGVGARGLYITGAANGSEVRGLIINNFSAQGIFIDTNSVKIAGNYIGIDSSGNVAMPNGDDGVAIYSGAPALSTKAYGNVIGGSVAADRNVISGNRGNGIGITATAGGSAYNNTVSGNYIGTNASGTSGIANGGDGLLINHSGSSAAIATGNVIGGTTTTPGGACTGTCNLISGNVANGVGLWHGGVSGTVVTGNYVGTNVSGTGSIANGNIGIEVNEAPNNTVGGTIPAARNVFSGNLGAGVFITGSAATGNVIQGNYIGVGSDGITKVANVKMGLSIGASIGANGATNNLIGGTTSTTPNGACTGACNVISGNSQNGIFISGSDSGNNTILGNFIGLAANGINAVGNTLDGIGILSTPNTTIGNGTNDGRNYIASNGANGIIVVGGGSTGNRINMNTIGKYGFGNTASGVSISSATDTAIISNSIFFNGLLGIDLDNNGTINKNDASDPDQGANRLQNYPNIYSAKTTNGVTKIGGNFNSTPSTGYLLQFYASDACNGGVPSNYGEGQTYLGSVDISTDVFGNTAYGFTASSAVNGVKYITATATKKIGATASETSEFSKCVLLNISKPALTNGTSWFLKDYLTTGPADTTFSYGMPADLLMCAWDPNQPGVKLPVVVVNSTWFMRASYTTGTADVTLQYGFPGAKPVCGDWNGDGVDTPGLAADSSNLQKIWFLRNTNSTGVADITFYFGPLYSNPIVGDWNGDGVDTIGLMQALPGGGSRWSLRNTNNSGGIDYGTFGFDLGAWGKPVSGDWDSNGSDEVGVMDNYGGWYLRTTKDTGSPNITFQYGFSGATPVIW